MRKRNSLTRPPRLARAAAILHRFRPSAPVSYNIACIEPRRPAHKSSIIGRFPRISPAGLFLLVLGCGDVPTSVDVPGKAKLIVMANLAGTATNALVIEVSAPDIPTPLIFNLPIDGEAATGAITLPAGSDRILIARAFDGAGVETHRGSRTLRILGGTNEVVAIALLPLHGDQPIEITLGSFTVSVVPGSLTIAPGETVQLEATVRDADHDIVADALVQWGSLDLSVATANTAGLVTGHAVGESQVVALYAGAAASALVTVRP